MSTESRVDRVEGIFLEGVTKIYPNGVRAVDNVSLEIGPAEFMVLVGPSGCGKSTLLRMIAGLESVDEGWITIGGRDVTDEAPRARDIAMVFQNYALYPHMTTRENLAFGLKMRKAPKSTISRQVTDVAQILGLEGLMTRRPAQLSGGQRQRVAIGRAMVREPAAYLMDEPLSNLDAKLRVAMRAELARLHERLGVTTVYVTHDQVEAMTLGQRVAVLRDGVLQQCDVPQALFDSPANLFVAAFIGSPAMNLVAADVGDGSIDFAGLTLPAPAHLLPEPGRRVILGIRPQDLSLTTGGNAARILARIEIVEELGADSIVIFGVDAPPVVAEAVTAAQNAASDDEARLLMDDARALWTARLTGRDYVRVGSTVDLGVDVHHLHFFEPETGQAIDTHSHVAARS